jgi:hypothetical protein
MFLLYYSQFVSCWNTKSKSFTSSKTQEILNQVKKDGLKKEADIFVKETCSVYKVCSEHLLKWTVSFKESDCLCWTNVNDALSFSDVRSIIKYLRDRDVTVDDVRRFYELSNLKTFVRNFHNNEGFKSASFSDTCVKNFQNSCNFDCHSQLFKIVEFFFCVLSHNADVERIFSLMNAQQTDEQNRFTT